MGDPTPERLLVSPQAMGRTMLRVGAACVVLGAVGFGGSGCAETSCEETRTCASASTGGADAALPGISEVRAQDGLGKAGWVSFEAEFSGDDASLQSLLSALVAQGLPIVHFSEVTQDLEEVFMRTTRGIVS